MHLTRNIGLVLRQVARGGLITLVVIAAVAGLNAAVMAQRGDFSGAEIAAAVVGIVSAILFLKAGFLFAFYRFFSKTAFEGSFFVIALLVTIFLIIAVAAASILARSRLEGFPTEELPFLLMGLYAVVAVFLFGAFRISHWFFGLFGSK